MTREGIPPRIEFGQPPVKPLRRLTDYRAQVAPVASVRCIGEIVQQPRINARLPMLLCLRHREEWHIAIRTHPVCGSRFRSLNGQCRMCRNNHEEEEKPCSDARAQASYSVFRHPAPR